MAGRIEQATGRQFDINSVNEPPATSPQIISNLNFSQNRLQSNCHQKMTGICFKDNSWSICLLLINRNILKAAQKALRK